MSRQRTPHELSVMIIKQGLAIAQAWMAGASPSHFGGLLDEMVALIEEYRSLS